MAKHTVEETPEHGGSMAPSVPHYHPPQRTMERRGNVSAPMVNRYPQIRGGVCEYCGVLDSKLPSEMQYRICGHFRDLGEIRCTYCPETRNPTEVIIHSVMNVVSSPTNPNELIAWCNSFECSKAHLERFNRAVN